MAWGKLIAFEGIDGSGKTTQAARLAESLRSWGLVVSLESEPTRETMAGRKVRQLLEAGEELPPGDELAYFLEDRRAHVSVIRERLARGEWVVLDRYYASTVAYQQDYPVWRLVGDHRGWVVAPDLWIYLNCPVSVALERIEARGKALAIEGEARLRSATARYGEVFAMNERVVLVSADDPSEVVAANVQRAVGAMLSRLFRPPA